MPSSSRRRQVERQVVDEHALLGRHARRARRRARTSARAGLRDALLAGDHDAVEQLVEQVVRVAVHAPRVRHERRAHAAPRAPGATASTIATSGCTPANRPSISPSGSTPSSAREAAARTRASSSSPFSSAISSSRTAGSGGEAAAQRLRVDRPRARSSSWKDVNRLRRQHAAPVDQQAAAQARRSRSPFGSAAIRDRLGLARQLEHALAELSSGTGRRSCPRRRACSCPP